MHRMSQTKNPSIRKLHPIQVRPSAATTSSNRSILPRLVAPRANPCQGIRSTPTKKRGSESRKRFTISDCVYYYVCKSYRMGTRALCYAFNRGALPLSRDHKPTNEEERLRVT